MGYNWTTRPADHRTVTTGKFRHIFLTADALTFTISAGAATTWKVRDYYFNIVAQGSGLSTGATSITLNSSNIVGGASILPFGWYKLYLERSVAAADPWGLSGGDLPFVRVPTSLILPTRPGTSDPTGSDFASDYASMGFMRTGPFRHTLYLDAPRYASSKSTGLSDAALEATTWGTVDTNRPLRPMACFPEDTGGSTPSGTFTSNITSAVTDFIAAGVTRFEGRNEPNVTTPTGSTYVAEEQAFANTVRAAGGTVLGPCPVSVVGKEFNDWNPGANTGWAWLNSFFTGGGGAYIDEFSFHNYNGAGGATNFGPGVTPIRQGLPYLRYTLDNLVALLTKYGQQNKPRYNTEAFSQFTSHFGSNEWRLQTQNTMLEMHMLEQYGVPKERTSIFYPKSHGFWDFPSWLINEGGSNWTPNPLVAVIRTWSDELAGKGYTARLDFGTVENNHYLGSRFTASSGASVVVMQSDGRYGGQVSLQVSGSAGPLTMVDAWGNQSSLAVTNGLATVTVDTLPVYVRLPAGVTAVPVAVDYGIDTVTPRSVYVTKALANATTFPNATKTVTFPNTTRIDTVIVTTEPMFQSRCGLLDFDVQTFTGGSWVTQATKVVSTNTIAWTGHQDTGGGLTDSAYDRSNVFVFKFPDDVTCTAVRVFVRDVTYGGEPTVAATNGNGFVNQWNLSLSGSPTGGTFTLVWNGLTTGTIAWNASAATVQTALRALAGGSATTVTGGTALPTGPLLIDFKNALSYRSLAVGTNSLTGGTSPNVSLSDVPSFLGGSSDSKGTGQAGPKVLACEIEAFLSGKTDGGGVAPGQPFIILTG